MHPNREALLKFIEWVEDHADELVSYEESVDFMRSMGLRYRLACMQRQESFKVAITSPLPIEDLEAMKIEVLGNIGPLTNEEYEIRQIGRYTFKKEKRVYFPIDDFELLIEWGKKRATITIFGPYFARLADAYLHNDTSPGISVPALATGVSKLLTGEEPGSSPCIGTRMSAEWRSTEAIKILKSYVSSLDE